MNTVNLVQGSEEWLKFRAGFDTASEAPAMLGESKYQSRDELLAVKKSGVEIEVSEFTQRIFDNGHAFEALARPIAEEIIGEEIYPVTGFETISGLSLSASFDGLTMLEDVSWEHKSINDELRKCLPNGDIPIMYKIQMEQQFLISCAEKCLFMASDGTRESMVYAWYFHDEELSKKIISGWKQFNIDLIDFDQKEKRASSVGKAVESLPALIVNVSGQVSTTNIDEFKEHAMEFIGGINKSLESDQDFANAETAVKACKKAEENIKIVKKMSVDQMTEVSKIFKTMDYISDELKNTRLSLDKLIKIEKENKKMRIIGDAVSAVGAFVAEINKEFDMPFIDVPNNNFGAAIKGKKTIASIQSAVNDETARIKIEVNGLAVTIRGNLKIKGREIALYDFLFKDLKYIIQKETSDFDLLVKSRIDDYEKREIELKNKKEKEEMQAEKEIKESIYLNKKENIIEKSEIKRAESSSKESAMNGIDFDELEKNGWKKQGVGMYYPPEVVINAIKNKFNEYTAKKIQKLLCRN